MFFDYGSFLFSLLFQSVTDDFDLWIHNILSTLLLVHIVLVILYFRLALALSLFTALLYPTYIHIISIMNPQYFMTVVNNIKLRKKEEIENSATQYQFKIHATWSRWQSGKTKVGSLATTCRPASPIMKSRGHCQYLWFTFTPRKALMALHAVSNYATLLDIFTIANYYVARLITTVRFPGPFLPIVTVDTVFQKCPLSAHIVI